MSKKAATHVEIVKSIQAPGRYLARVRSQDEARRILQQAMPFTLELPPATGEPYPKPPAGCKKWYQLHPPEPNVGHDRAHFKYEDWTGGKKGQGGRWGHIEF